MNTQFATQLKALRIGANLTNAELAHLAQAPKSLILSLQRGERRIGEYQARKIATALNLRDKALEQFVLNAIDNCTEKVLKDSQEYPAELLNLLALQLRGSGVLPDKIERMSVTGDKTEKDITLLMADGKRARLKTQLAFLN